MSDTRPAIVARIVHSRPGRLRVRLPREALVQDRGRELAERVRQGAGVRAVRVGRQASSLLVTYDREATDEQAVREALHAAGVHVTASASAAPAVAGAVPAANQVVDRLASNWNLRLGSATGQVFDLRTIVPLGLGALALREILAGRLSAAPWYTLLW